MPKTTPNSPKFPEVSSSNFSDVLTYYCESLLGIENEEEVLWDLAKNCISKLGFVDCVVYLLDDKRNVMIQKAAYGPKNPKNLEIFQPVERPLGFGIVGHVAQSGNAALIHDTSLDERYEPDDEFRFSEVCVPIIMDSRVMGIIDCEHPRKYFFSEHHLNMLLTMSSITALKLKKHTHA
ncbi:MAG: GAF domain-containing protein [Bacteroidota bacterium]